MKQTSFPHSLFSTSEALGELILMPFNRFASMQAASGALLLAVTAAALFWSNSDLAGSYNWLKHMHLQIKVGDYSLDKSAHFWVNEGLMTFFFFVVGLEIKREILVGELSSLRQASLPVAAALGGMVAPALLYYLFNAQTSWEKGWAIPMATDIAFTMAAFTLLGSRVPHTLKVFFAALAIVDDLGAVAVIAMFYTSQLATNYLFQAFIWFLLLVSFNLLGYRRPLPYLIVGGIVWWSFYMSGIHSTVAGILVAFAIPARSRRDMTAFRDRLKKMSDRLRNIDKSATSDHMNENGQMIVRKIENLCRDAQNPLQRIEYSLHPWVVFLIVPLFALTNAGVILDWGSIYETFTTSLSLGITVGLVIGKQLGIALAVWLTVKSGLAVMPSGASFGQVYGAAVLCGVGFTMSIFVADLAFGESPDLESAKISILVGSLISFLVGFLILHLTSRKRSEAGEEMEAVNV